MTNRYFVYKIFLALSLLVVGCTIIRSEGFTYQESVPVEVDYLRLYGYYYRVETSSPPDKGKHIYPLSLWKDETAVYSNRGYSKILSGNYEPGEPVIYGRLEEARHEFESNIDSIVTGDKSRYLHWGRFRVRGDSISMQAMWFDGNVFQKKYRAIELSGVILDDTTFVLNRRENFSGRHEGAHRIDDMKYHFCPLEEGEKPPSDNWTQSHPELQ